MKKKSIHVLTRHYSRVPIVFLLFDPIVAAINTCLISLNYSTDTSVACELRPFFG